MNKKPYSDNIATLIPQWYADTKYDRNKSTRQNYIDNALDPYKKAYSFYTMREMLKKKLLDEANVKEKERREKLNVREGLLALSNWRNKITFLP